MCANGVFFVVLLAALLTALAAFGRGAEGRERGGTRSRRDLGTRQRLLLCLREQLVRERYIITRERESWGGDLQAFLLQLRTASRSLTFSLPKMSRLAECIYMY